MSTVVVATVKSNTSSPPAFQNTSGTEIGTLCRAWVNFNGTGVVAIRAQFNVSSITDNGTGDYTVNFTTAMPNANYCVTGCVKELDSTAVTSVFLNIGAEQTVANTYALGSIRVTTQSGITRYDSVAVNVAIFR